MAKHAAHPQAMRATGTGPQGSGVGPFRAWAQKHPGAATVLVSAACLAALCLIFFFVVFSDFGGSADFIYNQF